MSIGVPLDSIGEEGLGRMGGRGRWSIEKGIDQGRTEHMGAVVVDQSVD